MTRDPDFPFQVVNQGGVGVIRYSLQDIADAHDAVEKAAVATVVVEIP